MDSAREIELKKNNGSLINSENVTFAKYFDKWINAYKIGRRDETTENKYINAQKFIANYFGSTLLKNVSKIDYQKMLDEYGKTHVRSSVSTLNSYVRAVVTDAIDDNIISRNFTNKAEITGLTPTHRIKYLEENEAIKLRDFCIKTSSVFLVTHAEIAVALACGFRYAEVAGLTWDNINFDQNQITVNKTYDYKNRNGFKKTKTESSMRTIDVDVLTMNMLKRFKIEQNKVFLKQGFKNEMNLVFINNKHQVPTNTGANKAMKECFKKLEINKTLTFHGLRHTHASMLIAHQVSIEYVAERLGHSNTSITAKVYIHLLQTRRDTEIKKTLNLFTNVNR